MNQTATPVTRQSSMSPYESQARRAAFSYPSPCHSDSTSTPERGLGLYDCPLPVPSTITTSVIPPSSPSSAEYWPRSSVSDPSSLSSTHGPPDIFSEAYDPFASFHNSPQPVYVGTTFTSTPSMTQAALASPSLSGNGSQRSSFSSCGASDAYSAHGSARGFTPKPRPEDSNEWYHNEQQQQNTGMQNTMRAHDILQPHESPYSASPMPPMYTWAKADFDDRYRAQSASHSNLLSQSPLISNVERIRKRRKLTTAAEANHECSICGKLFGRSYNYKAHMETHDPSRVYPHPCTAKGCGKKFVRKTDLTRHHQSVHMKQRNYRCELCGNLFARKDTLRRHTEDGCSKRFEISPKMLQARADAAAAQQQQQQQQHKPRFVPTLPSSYLQPSSSSSNMIPRIRSNSAASNMPYHPLVVPSSSPGEISSLPPLESHHPVLYGKADYGPSAASVGGAPGVMWG